MLFFQRAAAHVFASLAAVFTGELGWSEQALDCPLLTRHCGAGTPLLPHGTAELAERAATEDRGAVTSCARPGLSPSVLPL